MKVFVKILMLLALLAIVEIPLVTSKKAQECRRTEETKEKSWFESSLGWTDVRNAINEFSQSAFKVATDCYAIVQDVSNPEYVVLRNMQQNQQEQKQKEKQQDDDEKFNFGLRMKFLPF